MGKPSSMASLRERARAFLGGEKDGNGSGSGNHKERQIVDLSREARDGEVHTWEKRTSNSKMVQFTNSTTTNSSPNTQLPQQRLSTPGANSTLGMSTSANPNSHSPAHRERGEGRVKGLVRAFKGVLGMKSGPAMGVGERVDETSV